MFCLLGFSAAVAGREDDAGIDTPSLSPCVQMRRIHQGKAQRLGFIQHWIFSAVSFSCSVDMSFCGALTFFAKV